jgi:hypothetical protein
MHVYLSGGMEYAADEGRGWREALETWLRENRGWSVFNPNRESEKFLSGRYPGVPFRDWKHTHPERFREIVSQIVDLDCREIAERCDVVICYWDASAHRGAGTKGELTIARYFDKPVYLVTEMPAAEIPGWVLGCTSRIFADFDSLKDYLRDNHTE